MRVTVFEDTTSQAAKRQNARSKYLSHFNSSYRVKPMSERVMRRLKGLSARQWRKLKKRMRRQPAG
jgi:hypothetical protein